MAFNTHSHRPHVSCTLAGRTVSVRTNGKWTHHEGITRMFGGPAGGTLTLMRGRERVATFIVQGSPNAGARVQRKGSRVIDRAGIFLEAYAIVLYLDMRTDGQDQDHADARRVWRALTN